MALYGVCWCAGPCSTADWADAGSFFAHDGGAPSLAPAGATLVAGVPFLLTLQGADLTAGERIRVVPVGQVTPTEQRKRTCTGPLSPLR